MFNSTGQCYCHIGLDTLFFMKVFSNLFPSLTNQGPCLYRGGAVTSHTGTCRVSLESVGGEGGLGVGGGLASPVMHGGFSDSLGLFICKTTAKIVKSEKVFGMTLYFNIF